VLASSGQGVGVSPRGAGQGRRPGPRVRPGLTYSLVQKQERVMSLQASQVIVSRQVDAYEIVFENSERQAVVRLSQALLIHLSRQVTRALGGSGESG
jgi:hypothetical protein